MLFWLINALIWFARDYRTRNWPTVKGEVQSSQLSYSRVVVTYKYTLDNQRFTGIHERSFGSNTAAEDHAKLFIPKWSLVVRYNGAYPERSRVIENDQAPTPGHRATEMPINPIQRNSSNSGR